jgi:transcriptional adapter 2-alpha
MNESSSDSMSESSSYSIEKGRLKTMAHCSYCKVDITDEFRAKCVECSTEDVPYELCADCFCVGTNATPHKCTHKYRINDCLHVPLFAPNWTVHEELLLLDGIEEYGMGSWKDVAAHIGTKKTKEVESHYWEVYMGRHGYCLPLETIIDGTTVPTETWIDDSSVTIDSESHKMRTALLSNHQMGDVVVRDIGKEPVGKVTRGRNRGRKQIRKKKARLPLREDSDSELDEDEVKLIANMDFDEDDDPSEVALKLRVIRIYNRKLNEREEKKRAAIDRGSIDFNPQLQVMIIE